MNSDQSEKNMSHVSFSKLLTIKNYPKLYPKPSPQSTLAEVLQSEPVKRLLSQPNIVIKTIPGTCATDWNTTLPNNVPVAVEKKKTVPIKRTQIDNVAPKVSISRPAASERKDESRLLPAKGDGNSEISILVIEPKQKDCGHSEPCENIVCDVSVQQFIDQSGVLPMLAVGIEEDEINAPVSKHCRNPLCDALSIEHDRCRRALIKLYRYDEASACDICGVVFKTRRSRMSHRNCTRKEVYRHNQTNGAEILREKMRERELQMLQAAKLKRKEYTDPAMEYKKIMETLRKNDELIVIPKSLPIPQPIITITTVSSQDLNSPQHTSSKNVYPKLAPSVSIALPPQRVGVAKRPGIGTDEGPSAKQSKVTNIFCSGLTMASLPTIQTSGQHFIKVTSVTQPNFVQPISLNDWFVSQANIVGSDKGRSLKPYLTPIRVVPITSLKSAPSLRHQTHGIPAFCLVPENLAKPAAVTKLQTIQPAPVAQSATPIVKNETNDEPAVEVTPKARRRSQGIKSEERIAKIFKCPFCLKGFSTDWYFKMHVAGHKGEVLFTCKTCEKPFSNRYDLKKHMLNDHNDGECRCETCGQISICKSALEIHIRSHTGERPFRCTECDMSYRSSTDLKTHRRKRHNSADCFYCHLPFAKTDLQAHLISCHMLTEDEALHEISKSQDQNFNSNESSDNLELEIDASDCETMAHEILSRVKEELTDVDANGIEAAQQDHMDSNKRKKQNRNKNSKIVQSNSGHSEVAEGHPKRVDTKPGVRRSARRSNSAVLCTICKNHFDSTSLLEKHLASKPKDAVECQCCKSLFHSQTEYKKHTMTCGKSSRTQLKNVA